MKILIVGSGGREHALAWKVKQSPLCSELFVSPGNAGTSEIATNLAGGDLQEIVAQCKDKAIDLVVVGPEAPLAEGLVDECDKAGIKVFGPVKAAAKLEASKSFSKEIMIAAGVPTAESGVFSNYEEALAFLEEFVSRYPNEGVVLKADGLAAGKGVIVADDLESAKKGLSELMLDKAFGSAGDSILIERRLQGRETSIMAIVDGDSYKALPTSRDYKRLLDGDAGPNTGGMGAVSPSPVIPESKLEEVCELVIAPISKELKKRGVHYRGFLYAGLMVGDDGEINVLEYNCRLGDPETQVLLPRVESDLVEVLLAAIDSRLEEVDFSLSAAHTACIVAASEGYPGTCNDNKLIEGLFSETEDTRVFQAGTKSTEDGVFSKGGRILVVSASGANQEDALKKAYSGLSKISFEGMSFRKDIGA